MFICQKVAAMTEIKSLSFLNQCENKSEILKTKLHRRAKLIIIRIEYQKDLCQQDKKMKRLEWTFK